jgi:hypothetical protein
VFFELDSQAHQMAFFSPSSQAFNIVFLQFSEGKKPDPLLYVTIHRVENCQGRDGHDVNPDEITTGLPRLTDPFVRKD